MVSKKERRVVQLIYLMNTFSKTWEEKLDALGDMIHEVGPIRIQSSDGMFHRFYIDKVSGEVRHQRSMEVEVKEGQNMAPAMMVLNSLHEEGKLV